MNNFVVLLGTARQYSMSLVVYNFVINYLKKSNKIKITPIDINNYLSSKTLGLSESKTKEYKDIINGCDGLIIVSPEYNHGYPGELKLLLDNAYHEYCGKPVAICGVSDGPLGGSRMAEQLKLVLSAFQMIIINSAVYFSNVKEIFQKDGSIKNVDFWTSRLDGVLEQMIKYSKN